MVARELLAAGHVVHNFDQVKCTVSGIHTIPLDVTNFGDVVSAFRGYDGIVHLAAISAPNRAPNNRIFRDNTQSTFNVLEAASILGIRHVVLTSSINAMGLVFNLKPCVHYFPVDEDHPCAPDEAYGLSKLVGEIVADGFARRYPEMTICSLRFPVIVMPQYYRSADCDVEFWRKNLWTYCDSREAGRAACLSLEAKWRGHEVFFITADHSPSPEPSVKIAAQWYPDVPFKRPLEGNAPLVSSDKALRLLGWRHERTFEQCIAENKSASA